MTGVGYIERKLIAEEIRELVTAAAMQMQVVGKRVLIVIPDGTRTMPMPMLFEMLQEEIGGRAAVCDYLVALGTHPLMSDAQLSALVGQQVVNGLCGTSRISNHRWDIAETFAEIGTIPAKEVERISRGLLQDELPVRINRMVLEYDQVVICGPVFPHEVVGFSGGNKYLFPGVGGPEMIGQTHWLGALIGSYEMIGTQTTPVREMIDTAAAMVKTPVACLALVVTHDGVSGAYFGSAKDAWKAASELSSQIHVNWVERPFKRVLSVMPTLYADLWTAAKGMYKVEPAVADGGEVVIYAPHISEVSYTHGANIDRVGYHCRDYFLKQWEKFKDEPKGVLAHSTHLRGRGTYDLATGVEKTRIRVTLATGIPEERCRDLNLGYLDPTTLHLEEWRDREDDDIKLIPRAGETLYRLKESASP